MKLSPITCALRAAGFTAQTLGLAIPLSAVLSHNAWADPSTVSASDAAATSTNGAATTLSFPLTRTGDSSYASVVTYTTQDGTAVAPGDYTSSSGSIAIPVGATSASINVSIPGHLSQGDKQFSLQLLGATGIGPTPNLAAQQTFATDSPSRVTTADLNGDGKPDLVAANYLSNTVSVFLNTTAPGSTVPSYASPQTFATGTFPISVTAVDFNGDGKPDLAVANYSSNTVSVLLNTTATGDSVPSYAVQQTFGTGGSPGSVTTADVNGDRKPDLAIAIYGANKIAVLLNTTAAGATNSSYAALRTFATGSSPRSITSADLNGDGRPDLAVANYGSGTVSVLLNTTTAGAITPSYASQQTFASGSLSYLVTTADLNGDGKTDLAIANSTLAGTVSVLLNTTAIGATTPSYATRQSFATAARPRWITAADLNGDGKLDLTIANYSSSSVSMLLNTTATGVTSASYAAQQTFATGARPYSIAAADLNGDGKPDLAVANLISNTVSVLLNTTPAPATTFGSGTLAARQTFATGFSPSSVTAADFNGDGKLDLATANYGAITVSVLLNTTAAGASGPSYATQQTFYAGSPRTVTTADINGDGRPDLAVTYDVSPKVLVLLNTTTAGATTSSFAVGKTFATGTQPLSVTTADFNGDGKPDLAVANFGSNTVSVLLNTTAAGATTPSYATPEDLDAGSGSGPSSVAAADFNGDGKPDLAVTNQYSNAVLVLLNTTIVGDTTPSFDSQHAFATRINPISVTTADLNGDGRPDLAVANGTSNSVSVLLNTTAAGATTPSYAAQQTFTSGSGSRSVTTADFNGDGKLDLVVANTGQTTVSVLLNMTAIGATTSSYTARQTFATGNSPSSVTTADLNGDGKPDLAVANGTSNSVAVLLNTQYQSTASATPATGTIHYVVPIVDLSLNQAANANPVQINTSGGITYSAAVHNNSASINATSLVLTENLAPQLTFNGFSSADGWSCSRSGQVVTCNLASLAFGASSTVDITADTGPTAVSVKTSGTVSAAQTDPAPANNNNNVTTLLCDPAAVNTISFGSASFSATEGVPVVITVNRSGTSCNNATVHYATTTGGSAPAGDFTATSGDFTWGPLDANTKTFTVNLANDAVYSGNRSVNLLLSSPSSNATLNKSTSVISIKDDEVPATIGLSTTDQSVGEEGGVGTVTATLSVARSKDTTVPLTITGTASRTKDYTLSATSILIPAGQLAGSAALTGLHDLLDEANETAIVKMGAVSGVTASGTTTNTITFTDDDATPAVSFDVASSTRAENKANSVNLVLSAVSGQNVTVNVSSTGGTAAQGADYTINGSGTITIPAGATTATTVAIIDDTAHEGSETAVFHIDGATNATPSGIVDTTLTITDNDP